MKKTFLSILISLVTIGAIAQSVGDTIVVPTFNYSMTYKSGNRDTMAYFPTDTDAL